MSSDKVAELLTAIEEQNNGHQENQWKIVDTMNMMVSGDASIESNGAILPVIEKNSLVQLIIQ